MNTLTLQLSAFEFRRELNKSLSKRRLFQRAPLVVKEHPEEHYTPPADAFVRLNPLADAFRRVGM